MVIWLVGLSGSGKTTIGNEVYKQWKSIEKNTVLIDGDEIRNIFKYDTNPQNYTVEGRRINANRIVELCKWLDNQNINVVCCILCIFDDLMIKNRRYFSDYYQVYIDASIDLLEKRDVKGIYQRARQGSEKNVVGIDIQFNPPTTSDYVIKMNNHTKSPDKLAEKILINAGIIKK